MNETSESQSATGSDRDEFSIDGAETIKARVGVALGRIDRYELLKELGGGGFGRVFLARDAMAGIEVAVKGLPGEVAHNPDELERVRANFALVVKLHHPRIAALLHLHRADKVWYANDAVKRALRVLEEDYLLVMEYAPGVTLGQWRKQFKGGKVPVAQALAVCAQVAEALDYAHERKIVHRDVKPANVMVETDANGRISCRVLDFGLAAEIRSTMSRVSKDIVGGQSGTRPYMAPEQWRGMRADGRTDQYALAAMFYELVGGEVPFAGAFETNDPMIMMNAVVSVSPEPLAELTEAQNAALFRALAKKREERHETCMEFINSMQGAQETMEEPVEVPPSTLANHPKPEPLSKDLLIENMRALDSEKLDDLDEWISLAQAWNDHGEVQLSRKCSDTALGLIKEHFDETGGVNLIEMSWGYDFPLSQQLLRPLIERYVDDTKLSPPETEDWIRIAHLWRRADSLPDAARCLLKAEEEAEDDERNLRECDEAWQNIYGSGWAEEKKRHAARLSFLKDSVSTASDQQLEAEIRRKKVNWPVWLFIINAFAIAVLVGELVKYFDFHALKQLLAWQDQHKWSIGINIVLAFVAGVGVTFGMGKIFGFSWHLDVDERAICTNCRKPFAWRKGKSLHPWYAYKAEEPDDSMDPDECEICPNCGAKFR